MRAAELCEFGAYSSALGGRNLEVAKAGKCMIHLMLETGCEQPEDLLSRVRPRGQRAVVEKVVTWVRRLCHLFLLIAAVWITWAFMGYLNTVGGKSFAE
jgi:hypothetical protein